MFKVAVAHSLELDSADAVADVLRQCRDQLGELNAQAGLLFAGIDHDHVLILKHLYEAYPDMELIGCTTDGEVSSAHGFSDDSVTLMAFCSDELPFKAGVAEHISLDTVKTVRKAVDSAVSELSQDPALILMTPSSIDVSGALISGDRVLKGIKLSLGEEFPILGGAAADQGRLRRTYQFYHSSVFIDAMPFLLLAGPLKYSFGVASGWFPIGAKEPVTESHNNIIYKIGNDTALNFYEHYLGEDIGLGLTGIISDYPLAIFERDSEDFYLRAGMITERDRENGTYQTAGDVPEGSMVQIAHANRDDIIAAAERSIRTSLAGYPGTDPAAAVCFSCNSRKMVLGTRVKEEYLAFTESYPNLPVIGFYSYGETAPLKKDQTARYHNETFVNLVIGME